MVSYGDTKWEIGKPITLSKEGVQMCTDQVFHCYNHPALAIIFNPIHANIKNPKLFEIEVDKIVATDGLKFASKSQTLIKELPLPQIELIQKIEFAIRVAKLVYKDEQWNIWADAWLNKENCSWDSANAACSWGSANAAAANYDAYAAACAATRAAADAARAAARAASAAAYAAADAARAASAAASAADAARAAARAASAAAYAAADAARAAAYAANADAYAADADAARAAAAADAADAADDADAIDYLNQKMITIIESILDKQQG